MRDEIGDPTTFFRSLGIPTVQIGTHEKQLIRILSEVARNLTESIRLPIDINSYAIHFNEELTHMKKRFSGDKLGPLLGKRYLGLFPLKYKKPVR